MPGRTRTRNLWTAVTEGIDAFMKDLREHNHADNVIS